MKEKVYDVIKISYYKNESGKRFDHFIVLAIIINIVSCIIETFDVGDNIKQVLTALEWITIIFFTIEYILRIWTADCLYKNVGKIRAKIKYIFSGWGLIDLLSFFPFYLPFFFPNGIMVFRMFRVMRMIRLFRLNRRSDALDIIYKTLVSKKRQLISSVFIIMLLMISASLIMYDLEHEAQPELFKNAFSGLWWSTSAIFTVGYGDIYPITFPGQVMSIIISILGVGLIALPTGIIYAGFVEQIDKGKKQKYCPHCGKEL